MARFAVPEKRLKQWKNFAKQALPIVWILEAIAILVLVGYLFYDRMWAGVFFSPWIWMYFRKRKKRAEQKKREELTASFKEGMQSIATSLSAGYSLENAVEEATGELLLLHGAEDGAVKGFQKIRYSISMNGCVEDAFAEFARESQVEEIDYFAQVLSYAKKNGGNLIEIIRNTTDMISEKLEIKREIETMTTAKRYEQNIMNVIPLLMIGYMRFSSFGLMEKLYGNPFGVAVMTFCLFMYFAGIWLAERILKIEV